MRQNFINDVHQTLMLIENDFADVKYYLSHILDGDIK